MLTPLTAGCIAAAAAIFQVPEAAIWTILKTEGGQLGACVAQVNGTHDCGPAQINVETWVPHLARTLRRPANELREAVRDDGCFNVWVASYVLRSNLEQTGGDLWDAAGRYNSVTPGLKEAYQLRLSLSYDALFGPDRRRRKRS